jgi:hypothetical protein
LSANHDPCLVEIKASRVDSEETTFTTLDVMRPDSELGRRHQLTDLVRDLYPDAEPRSFDGEVASFLAQKLLIVARYRRGSDQTGPKAVPAVQQSLF